jgi:hypothetical protein
MNKKKFLDEYLESLIEKDKDIRNYFSSAKDDGERDLLKDRLRYSMERSYDEYARNYFDTKGVGSYAANILRYGGAAADAAGTYLFWAFGGAGFGMKGAGLLAKTAADAIDEVHYVREAKADSSLEKLTDSAKIAGEGVLERAAAYLPLGVGEIADLVRGRSKFDSKVISRALTYAKNDFISYIIERKEGKKEKEGKIISLDRFRHPAYSSSREMQEKQETKQAA